MPAKISDISSKTPVMAESNITNLQKLVTNINDYSKVITEYKDQYRHTRNVPSSTLTEIQQTINLKMSKINFDIIKVRFFFNTVDDLYKTNEYSFNTVNSEKDCNRYLKEFNCDGRLEFLQQVKAKTLSLLDTIQWIQDRGQAEKTLTLNDQEIPQQPLKEADIDHHQQDQQIHNKQQELIEISNGNSGQKQEVTVTSNENENEYDDKLLDNALDELKNLSQKNSNDQDPDLDEEVKRNDLLKDTFNILRLVDQTDNLDEPVDELIQSNDTVIAELQKMKPEPEKILTQPSNKNKPEPTETETKPAREEKEQVKQTTPLKKTPWYKNPRVLLTSAGFLLFSIVAICAYFKKFPTFKTMP